MAKTPKKADKNDTEKPSLSGSEEFFSKIEKNNIDQLFAQTLARYKKEESIDKKLKFKEISHLTLMAEEYLSCFALIGYSLQDEEVVVLNMPTPKDEAALMDLLRATFIDMVNDRP